MYIDFDIGGYEPRVYNLISTLFHKNQARLEVWELLFFFFYVKAYLGINIMKVVTNGMDHIETADKSMLR